jgi:hypothetical protein
VRHPTPRLSVLALFALHIRILRIPPGIILVFGDIRQFVQGEELWTDDAPCFAVAARPSEKLGQRIGLIVVDLLP